MTYQVRHRLYGIFQGEFLGMGFWWPDEQIAEPEAAWAREYRADPTYMAQGFCPLSEAEAQQFIDMLVKLPGHEGDYPYRREDFTLEPFDAQTSDALITQSRILDAQLHFPEDASCYLGTLR